MINHPASFLSFLNTAVPTLHADQPVAQPSEATISYAPATSLKGPSVTIELTDVRADIRIQTDKHGKLEAIINGRPHELNIENQSNSSININTGAADDRIIVDDNVLGKTVINSGDGKDNITSGGGRTVIQAGADDDRVQVGSGGGSADGGPGDDHIQGGPGWNTLKGGPGKNTLRTHEKEAYATTIESEGPEDTISALSGRALIWVSGGANIDAASSLRKATIWLATNSTGTNVLLDREEDAKNILIGVYGRKEGRDKLRVKQ